MRLSLLASLLQFYLLRECAAVNWLEWWTYDGISGPSFWGLINPEWSLCNQGQKQSPVDVVPSELLFDPGLEPIYINQNQVKGRVINTGHTATFRVDQGHHHLVNISGADLSYHYQVSSVVLHWGEDPSLGSEHTIQGKAAAAEIQILGYNGELYSSEEAAVRSPNGGVGIAILAQIGDKPNIELEKIIKGASRLKFAGSSTSVSGVSVAGLLPPTDHLVTYQGSLTQPGCQESITWILPNRPTYITSQQLDELKQLMQGTAEDPRAPLAGNLRPTQPTNGRLIRTNIDFDHNKDVDCDVSVPTAVRFEATSLWSQH